MKFNPMVAYVRDLVEEVDSRMESLEGSMKRDGSGNPVRCEEVARWNELFYALCDCRDKLKEALEKNKEVLER